MSILKLHNRFGDEIWVNSAKIVYFHSRKIKDLSTATEVEVTFIDLAGRDIDVMESPEVIARSVNLC